MYSLAAPKDVIDILLQLIPKSQVYRISTFHNSIQLVFTICYDNETTKVFIVFA